MSRFMMLFLCLTLFGFGCATTKKAPKEPATAKAKPESKLVEDFDPLALPDTVLVIEPKNNETQPQNPKTGTEKETTTPAKTDSQTVKTVTVQGFRIQIGAVTNPEGASELRREAMLAFESANVYMIYEPPYYKIRVGDFENRRDAEEFQEKAVAKGYSKAWIVRTVIEKKVVE